MDARAIVVGVDFGTTGDDALRLGLQLLSEGSAQAMHVVHVLDAAGHGLPAEEPAVEGDAAALAMIADNLARRVDLVAERERLAYYRALVRVEVRSGSTKGCLLRACEEHHADLLVIGTHGRHGIGRLLIGSVAEHMVRHAPCSVLVARPAQPPRRRVELHEGHDETRADESLAQDYEASAARGGKWWRPADRAAAREGQPARR